MNAFDSALAAPPFSVAQSLRRAFWRWSSWGELWFFGFCALAPSPFHHSLWGRLAYALAVFLGFRALDFADDLATTRFPASYGRHRATIFGLMGAALLAWLVFQFDWSWLATYRLDWRGASGVLLMGTVTVLFVGPPLEAWNRALKPFDRRANSTARRVGAALIYIAACCAWWALLVGAIYVVCSQPNLWR